MGIEARDDPTLAIGIDLYWIPLGAGGHVVRLNGRVYEAIKAVIQRRPQASLYHSALEIHVPDGRFVVEVTPVLGQGERERGVVVEGPVGARWAGRFQLFRYEIRRWLGGSIPDMSAAVSSPVRVANDLVSARKALELVPSVPPLVWGRDGSRAGDMWNSNSVVSWLLTRTGVNVEQISPPSGGRAPGWDAGIVVARREPGQPRSAP